MLGSKCVDLLLLARDVCFEDNTIQYNTRARMTAHPGVNLHHLHHLYVLNGFKIVPLVET